MVFAILTRHDPALPLAQLRGSGRVTEIRAADLCFTPPEASALLANVLETPVSEATGSSFIEATEGWAAGLRLAAEARRHTAGEPEPPSTAHPLDARAIHDYLIAEVLERQPPWVRARLLATSVAPSFDVSLCDELVDVLDEPDSDDGAGRAFVEYVARRDLFAVRSSATARAGCDITTFSPTFSAVSSPVSTETPPPTRFALGRPVA